VYAIAFGALTGQFLYLILDGNILSSVGAVGNIWKGTSISLYYIYTLLQALPDHEQMCTCFTIGILLILVAMIYPLMFFTLFASIRGAVQIISHVIGFVYVLLL